MNIPSVEFLGVVILWPVTVLTNLFLTIQCMFLFQNLYRAEPSAIAQIRISSWARFFVFLGISTLTDAIKYGLHDYPGVLYGSAVLVSSLAGGVATTFAQLATVETFVLRKNTRFFLRLVCYLQLIVFVAIATTIDGYLIVVANTAIGLTPVLFAHIIAWRFAYAGSGWIVSGLSMCAATGLIYGFRLSIGPWFTHVDLSHVAMIISLALISLGVNRNPPTHCFLQCKSCEEKS
jgi:hypothetical protein